MLKTNQIEKILEIIQQPIITEKTTRNKNIYVFRVKIKSNKKDIKKAIEYIFNVKVKKINTIKSITKTHPINNFKSKIIKYKKAIITLYNNNQINLFINH
uniref:Ribosomal protein L23 n=1 Tax=Harveyella mirabilis TaxID=282355 RepID=A0A3S8UW10_9FLOR|nr:ribosomal protein L23 [Harveyella mirabilis]